MLKYAQGKYHFTTGKEPGAKKWKDALEKMNNCPLHKQTRVYDIFGKIIPCNCGYHKVCNYKFDYFTYAGEHYNFFLHNRKLLMICAVKLEMFVRKSMSVYISPKLCPNNW